MGIWQITRKDLWLLVRDRRTLAVLIALPLLFITILGVTTGRLMNWQAENQLIQFAIVDDDHSELAAKVTHSLEKQDGLKVVQETDWDAARKQLSHGKYMVVVRIGPAFSSRVEQLGLGDILNPDRGNLATGLKYLDMNISSKPMFAKTAEIVGQLVFADTLRAIVPHVAGKNKMVARYLERREREDAEDEPQSTTASDVSEDPTPAPKNDFVYRAIVPSYTVMFAFFLINIMARSFISERDLGTLRRLRIAPISPVALLIGKTIPFYIVSLIQSGLLFLSGKALFGMSWGDAPLMLLPVMVCTSLAATTLGLLVATLVRTDQQVSSYANFLVIIMAGVSGCFMPRDWLPPVMQNVSLATPHAWALIAYGQLLTSEVIDYSAVWQSCGMLLAFSAIYFTLGAWRFREMH